MKRECKNLALFILLILILASFAQGQNEQQQVAEGPAVGLELVAEGLTAPIGLVPSPDETGRLFVVDQIGVIKILSDDGQLLDEPFLDIRDRMIELNDGYDERGLLGLAFSPNYAENGRFFVYYSAPLREEAPDEWNHTSHVSALTVSDDPNRADPNSEQVLLRVDEPQMNHNAGQITFGPDGYLYIPLGDGGGANDEDMGHVDDWYDVNAGGNGQDLAQNLLGTILRIDVNNQGDGKAYAIPEDNPFVGQEGAEEIWAYGFRNPWRISFDMGGDHALYAADLGQELYEEVDIVQKGGNYGWNVKEGTHCFSTQSPKEPPESCPESDPEGNPLIDPIIEHSHDVGIAIIGGYIYRGNNLPQLEGNYVFGDHATKEEHHGILLMATPAEGALWSLQKLQVAGEEHLPGRLLSFGQDGQGELYVLTSETEGPVGNTGKVLKLTEAQ